MPLFPFNILAPITLGRKGTKGDKGDPSTWADLTGKPSTFTPSEHSHDQFTTLTRTTPPVSTNEIKATATITVTDIPTVGQTLTVGGVVYTFASSAVNPFDIVMNAPSTTATVASEINNKINSKDRNVVATRSGSVVTLYALAEKEDGNLITLTTTAGNLTLSGATLTGGATATATATTGANMQYAVINSRHAFLCLLGNFGLTNWIRIS